MTIRVLSLGAGVQSTTVFLLGLQGDMRCHFDHAIFADTGEEPTPVYEHLAWLKSLAPDRIHVVSAGVRLGDALLKGENSTGQQYIAIPAYVKNTTNGKRGVGRRQCTKEFKLRVIERCIRRTILGMNPRQRIPKGVEVTQLIGLSADELRRAVGVQKRFKKIKWAKPSFPLIDMNWSRKDCLRFLENDVPHLVPRSACTFCPYRRNSEWRWLKENDPDGFDRAVMIDAKLREPGIVHRGTEYPLYVHDSLKPLSEVDFSETETLPGFQNDCVGMCGV